MCFVIVMIPNRNVPNVLENEHVNQPVSLPHSSCSEAVKLPSAGATTLAVGTVLTTLWMKVLFSVKLLWTVTVSLHNSANYHWNYHENSIKTGNPTQRFPAVDKCQKQVILKERSVHFKQKCILIFTEQQMLGSSLGAVCSFSWRWGSAWCHQSSRRCVHCGETIWMDTIKDQVFYKRDLKCGGTRI